MTIPAGAATPPSESPLTPIADGFALAGPSNLPDPRTHAYRKDLADTALAGRVIASHYAEPLARSLKSDTPLLAAASNDADVLATLKAGDCLRILDNSRGWGWGYAPDGTVGYVSAKALS